MYMNGSFFESHPGIHAILHILVIVGSCVVILLVPNRYEQVISAAVVALLCGILMLAEFISYRVGRLFHYQSVTLAVLPKIIIFVALMIFCCLLLSIILLGKDNSYDSVIFSIALVTVFVLLVVAGFIRGIGSSKNHGF